MRIIENANDDNNLNSEDALKMGADASGRVLADSGNVTVNNWTELMSNINDGAVIELSGDDVYYAEGSGIAIDSGTVTIDGKGHTIDAQGLNSHIFEINNGATLKLKNLILKNALNNGDGGAIYNNQGTLIIINCTFTNNTANYEKGGAIYNHEGTLKIVNSRFEKNVKYDKAIYNYGTEDDPFRLTIINTTMIEDKVCVNYEDNERRLDDKRDIDLLTTEVNAYIQEIIYNGTSVFISVAGIDEDFTGSVTVNITNTIYNTVISVANGKGNTTGNNTANVTKVIPTSLKASSVTTFYNGGKYIVATLKDSNGNPLSGVKITVKFSNGKTYTKTTDKNGQVKFSTNGLNPIKTYSAKLSFAGNAKYAKSTKTVSVKVNKAYIKMSVPNKTFKRSLKTKTYTVTLNNNQNKAMKNTLVILNINNIYYKVKTNSKGQATFKLTNLMRKGTFNVVVKYSGSKYYNLKYVKAKITVK